MAVTKTTWSKDNPSPGKPKGTLNVLTRTIRDRVLEAFNELQNDPKANLIEWGKSNPAMFYQIAAKLIPTEISATVSERVINVIVPSEFEDAKIIDENAIAPPSE